MICNYLRRTMSTALKRSFPHFAAGPVVKGFGRGSKELGIPTANFAEDVVGSLPTEMSTGIYYGLARVLDGPVHKMVMSVGWNPYYQNTKKSMETHILHKFSDDFYDSWLRVAVLGYIRPEKNFDSLDALITAIKEDIEFANVELDKQNLEHCWHHSFLKDPIQRLKDPNIVQEYNQNKFEDLPTASSTDPKETIDNLSDAKSAATAVTTNGHTAVAPEAVKKSPPPASTNGHGG